MGHDISAYRDITDITDEAVIIFSEEIAYNRRGSGSHLNKVLYIALEATQAYQGVSGGGDEFHFNREQLEGAREVLLKIDFSSIKREPNFMDDLIAKIVTLPDVTVDATTDRGGDGDVSQELKFTNDCIEHLNTTGDTHVRVVFS